MYISTLQLGSESCPHKTKVLVDCFEVCKDFDHIPRTDHQSRYFQWTIIGPRCICCLSKSISVVGIITCGALVRDTLAVTIFMLALFVFRISAQVFRWSDKSALFSVATEIPGSKCQNRASQSTTSIFPRFIFCKFTLSSSTTRSRRCKLWILTREHC